MGCHHRRSSASTWRAGEAEKQKEIKANFFPEGFIKLQFIKGSVTGEKLSYWTTTTITTTAQTLTTTANTSGTV
ncbi:hypothetical protein ElyMa_005591700 [Elysia marginata]|uniref:Uncharacterized protein n=1 Tax=Elysia marginata TaxID=1093978 RepID=A0AAV4F446_9GAST|nr:hypothetical protein ElyMa_005591700 [Elysia marginata]